MFGCLVVEVIGDKTSIRLDGTCCVMRSGSFNGISLRDGNDWKVWLDGGARCILLPSDHIIECQASRMPLVEIGASLVAEIYSWV